MPETMKPLTDIVQYKKLIEDTKKKCGTLITNSNVLFPDTIKQYTNQNSAYYVLGDKGVVFFFEEEDYFYIYANICQGFQMVLPESKKSFVLFYFYKENRPQKSMQMFLDIWKDIGLKENACFMNMVIIQDDILPFNLPTGYTAGQAQSKHFGQIVALFRSCLPTRNSPLPKEEDMSEDEVYCVLDEEGKVAAALKYSNNGNICTFKQAATVTEHRRKGLMLALMSTFVRGLHEKSIHKVQLWVNQDNTSAVKCYEKLGFIPDGNHSIQLLSLDNNGRK